MNTKLVHAGEPRPTIKGAVTTPIFQNSVFEFITPEESGSVKYPRVSNTPNHEVLNAKLSAIENGEAALVSSSGMAAISTVLLSLTAPGEHVLAQDSLYGGTFYFFRDEFPPTGRKSSYFPTDGTPDLAKYVTKETRVIYVESISNPVMKVPDLRAVADFGKKHGIITVIDNTFTSPYNFNPLDMGFDVVVHSATKYLNGHSDLLAGAIVSSKKLVEKFAKHQINYGGHLDPHTCYQLNRGVKTLALRVQRQNENAQALAQALASHPKIERVNYPGLPGHPDHARAREYFRGFGGMLSFEYKGTQAETVKALKRLRIPYLAGSLGGVETLCIIPALASHSAIPEPERRKMGIPDNLVRVSVGIEEAEDLIADFTVALNGN